MEMPKLFQIGDMAKLFHISVSSLRYYESLGLLTPERVDPDTGYRYYSVRQFEVLNTIRYLRELDMPLPEISDFLKNRDIDRMEEKLRQQKAEIERKRLELQRIERRIDNNLRRIRDAQDSELDVIKYAAAPAMRIVWMDAALKISSSLDMEMPIRELEQSQAETVLFLGKVGVGISAENLEAGSFEQYDGVFLILDDEDRFNGKTVLLPETQCVSVRFRGSHTEAAEQYRRLMEHIRAHGMKPSGFSREITMIDYGITSDREKFVTEISIPVAQIRTCPRRVRRGQVYIANIPAARRAKKPKKPSRGTSSAAHTGTSATERPSALTVSVPSRSPLRTGAGTLRRSSSLYSGSPPLGITATLLPVYSALTLSSRPSSTCTSGSGEPSLSGHRRKLEKA